MSPDIQLEGEPLKILLVEDSSEDALLLERHIRRAGYAAEILRVETEVEMRTALEGNEWSAVLADYHLPTFSALEALALVKSMELDLPFIVMSGAVSEETAVAAMRAGAHDYVSKQNLTRLLPALERELTEAQARRSRTVAEKALQSSRQRFDQLIQSIPVGLVLCNSYGSITYANRAAANLLGQEEDQLAASNVKLGSLVVSESRDIDHENNLPFAVTNPGELVEVICRTQKGNELPLLMGGAVLNPDDPPEERQIAAFFADISEQRRSHEILQRTEKLAAVGRLAASIAHEINNPLEAVTNCLYLLSYQEQSKAGRQYLEMAQQELNRVVQITTQTLRFYRQSTRPVQTDVRDLIRTVLALYEGRMRTFSISVEIKDRHVPTITAYDGEIRQVLANLIGNAVDAMQQVGGKLLLRTAPGRNWKNDQLGATITLADTGPGMPKDVLARIYEPFFSTKGLTGTGLGLWISKEIIAKHGGTIQVRSRRKAQSGTVFRLFLPLEIVAGAAHQKLELPILS